MALPLSCALQPRASPYPLPVVPLPDLRLLRLGLGLRIDDRWSAATKHMFVSMATDAF
jgi:hypothetical protein